MLPKAKNEEMNGLRHTIPNRNRDSRVWNRLLRHADERYRSAVLRCSSVLQSSGWPLVSWVAVGVTLYRL